MLLTDDRVIKRISETVVPLALNLYEFRNRPKDDPNSAVRLRNSFRYRPGVTPLRWQGIWFIDPERGEILATWDDQVYWSAREAGLQKYLDWHDAALKAFGKKVETRRVKPANPYPFRGTGTQPGGSVTLAVWFAGGTLDEITHSAKDWASFAPPAAAPGREWILPEAAGRKFSRILSGGSDLGHPQPVRVEDVKSVKVTGKVWSVTGDTAQVVYRGRITGERMRDDEVKSSDVTLSGAGAVDLATGRLRSLTLVFEGTMQNSKHPGKTGQVVSMAEWKEASSTPGGSR